MTATALRLDTFLPYRLSITSGRVSEAVASVYRNLFELTIPEWRVIAVVAESEGLTQQAIVERTLMDKVTISRASIVVLVKSTACVAFVNRTSISKYRKQVQRCSA